MIDFDALVAAALKEGISKEDLASQFTNAINKREKEENKVEKKITTREDVIEGIKDIFDEHCKNEHLDLADASALIWLCVIEDTEAGKAMTSPKELTEFLEFIAKDISHTIEKWETYKAIDGVFSGLKNKSKEIRGGTDRRLQSDQDIINRFLRELLE